MSLTKAQYEYRSALVKEALAKRNAYENAARQEMKTRFGKPIALVGANGELQQSRKPSQPSITQANEGR